MLAAAARGDAAEIKRLAAGGADVNVRDGYGRTPLHVATFRKNRDAITVLVQAGADINAKENDRYDAVTIAAVANDAGTLRMLLQLGASAKQVTSRYDGTALIAAAHLGHDHVVKILIEAGAPLDHVNNLGWTALIESIVLGNGGPHHTETLRALVQPAPTSTWPTATARRRWRWRARSATRRWCRFSKKPARADAAPSRKKMPGHRWPGQFEQTAAAVDELLAPETAAAAHAAHRAAREQLIGDFLLLGRQQPHRGP